MAETEQMPANRAPVPVGRAGGQLSTFIPQNMDEVKRMAQWAAIGGMAPKSLTDNKTAEAATAACAIAIMAGAELGLTPMMALRSYAVVNGRPTLWGDGLIAVVLKSSVYKQGSMKKGYDETKNEGWCEAERADGTQWRETFNMKQAAKAGLSTKKGPWQEYPDVMCTRRAISKCLNFLFADVLGGMVSEDEAYQDMGYIDVTPSRPTPPEPPAPPAPPEEKRPTEPAPPSEDASVGGEPASPTTAEQMTTSDTEQKLIDLEEGLSVAFASEDELQQVWDDAEIEVAFSDDQDALSRAFQIRKDALAALNRRLAEAAGQGSMFDDTFPGDR